jgi:uncharacterized protein (UPF0303 family)
MSAEDDISRVTAQEQGLVFESFDEHVAFKLGVAIRDRALRDGAPIAIEVRTWDRVLFFAGLPGSSFENADWIRRKVNTVKRVLKSSYRVVLEKKFEENYFPPGRGFNNDEHALAGGCFPIRLKGAGIVGTVTVSGVPQRRDHYYAVAGVCDTLGLDPADWSLPGE